MLLGYVATFENRKKNIGLTYKICDNKRFRNLLFLLHHRWKNLYEKKILSNFMTTRHEQGLNILNEIKKKTTISCFNF